MDAGWYGADTKPSKNEFEGDWWLRTGDWEASPFIHRNDLKDVADAVHKVCHWIRFVHFIDWDYNIARLKKAKKQEILNFELGINSKPGRHENDCYEKMSYEEYFTESYKRACRLAYKYSWK